MKQFTFFLLFILVSGSGIGRAGAQVAGKTHLLFSAGPTTSYTPNILEISFVENRKITGKVHLQFSIGPQGRAPQEWEKTHVLPFSATADAETGKVVFVVEVPQGIRKLRFAFSGYFFSGGGFAGIYSIDGKERGAFFTRAMTKPATQLIKEI
ncbi:hypothetical protein KKC22_14185 [Myxococcota bacterium]|nr:hypothetical protein [Myxococcota bacterium]